MGTIALIDLSPPVTGSAAHWPGDHGFTRAPRWSISDGASVSVATVTTTGHIGAHIDAPAHVTADGATSEATPLEAGIGPCVVIDVTALIDRGTTPHRFAPAAAIRERARWILEAMNSANNHEDPSATKRNVHERGASAETVSARAANSGTVNTDGANVPEFTRVLLRHRGASDTSGGNWYEDSPGLDPDFVRWFGEQGGLFLGVDLDSFDPLGSTDLPAHRAAVAAGVVIAEGLDLSRAPEGVAELVALPAHWVGTDAAPLRAVLRL